jgi:hypothetical protein
MKYITFEKSEYYSNLLRKYDYSTLTSYWIYDVYAIDFDTAELPLELQNQLEELPENIAKGAYFSHIDLNQRKTINVKVEQQLFSWIKDSLDINPNKVLNARDKFTYTITEEDEKNSVEFIKVILINYINKHINTLSEKNKKRYDKKINGIKANIQACNTNHDCHVIMHNHFNHPLLIVNDKLGTSLPGAQWNLSLPSKKTETEHFTPEMIDQGPTIDNISPTVFELKWEIGEPIEVKM